MSEGYPGHGLTPPERAIMDRHDEGMSIERIVEETGYQPARVRSVVDNYRYSVVNRFEADARRGSALLLKRLQLLQQRMGVSA